MPFMALLCLRKTGGTSPKTHVRYSVEMFTGGLVYTHSLKKKKNLFVHFLLLLSLLQKHGKNVPTIHWATSDRFCVFFIYLHIITL